MNEATWDPPALSTLSRRRAIAAQLARPYATRGFTAAGLYAPGTDGGSMLLNCTV